MSAEQLVQSCSKQGQLWCKTSVPLVMSSWACGICLTLEILQLLWALAPVLDPALRILFPYVQSAFPLVQFLLIAGFSFVCPSEKNLAHVSLPYPIREAYRGVIPLFSPKPFLLHAQQTYLSASPIPCAPVPKSFWWLSIAHAPVGQCLSCTRKPQTGCAPWDIVTEVTDREWPSLELLAILLLIHPIIWLASTALLTHFKHALD